MSELERAEAKVHELEHEASVGESARTPLILIGEVWFVCAVIVAVVLVIAYVAYLLA